MTGPRIRTSRRLLPMTVAVAAASAVALSACSGSGGATTTATPTASPTTALAGAGTSGNCNDGKPPTASIAPGSTSPDGSSGLTGPTITQIRQNKVLRVGISGDVRLWGARNPQTGELEGFDVDVASAIGRALHVPVTYKVINYGQRLPDLKQGLVDIVADQMTINCDRWQGAGTASAPNAINFSTAYYDAGQKVLVRYDVLHKQYEVESIEDLAKQVKAAPDQPGMKVCVAAASTSVAAISPYIPQQNQFTVSDLGDCLVKFEEGEVYAVTGDDTVLAGFAAQDPYARVVGKGSPSGDAFSSEPYGIGIRAGDTSFTQFVNAVLKQMISDGALKKIYNNTMGTVLKGTSYQVPQQVYGRNVAALKQAP